MTRRDGLLATAVAAIWGINFVVSALMLRELSPSLFTALRFFLVAFPAIFFVGRPTSGWLPALLMGFFIGIVQFSMMFWAMHLGLPAGLASLLIQFVTIFTLVLGVLILHELPHPVEWVGAGVVLLGILIAAAGGSRPLRVRRLETASVPD